MMSLGWGAGTLHSNDYPINRNQHGTVGSARTYHPRQRLKHTTKIINPLLPQQYQVHSLPSWHRLLVISNQTLRPTNKVTLAQVTYSILQTIHENSLTVTSVDHSQQKRPSISILAPQSKVGNTDDILSGSVQWETQPIPHAPAALLNYKRILQPPWVTLLAAPLSSIVRIKRI